MSSLGWSSSGDQRFRQRVPAAVVCVFVAAICLANLVVWVSGAWAPWVSLACGLVLVGLDMVIKDTLQDRWGVSWRLLLMIAGGGVAGFLAPGSARICAASVAAFTVSVLVDVAVFAALAHSPRRYVVSNAASALVDSSLFLWLGLGVFGWPVLAQTITKIAGAALWQRLLSRHLASRAGVGDVRPVPTSDDSLMSA